MDPGAMEKYPRLSGDFLQLSPGLGYFRVSGGICLLLPVWDFLGLTPDHFSGGGGGLGGKTLLPARDLRQLPFAESFKTESDQLRFANERPDGRGGGAGGKEPHRLRLQVVR